MKTLRAALLTLIAAFVVAALLSTPAAFAQAPQPAPHPSPIAPATLAWTAGMNAVAPQDGPPSITVLEFIQ